MNPSIPKSIELAVSKLLANVLPAGTHATCYVQEDATARPPRYPLHGFQEECKNKLNDENDFEGALHQPERYARVPAAGSLRRAAARIARVISGDLG